MTSSSHLPTSHPFFEHTSSAITTWVSSVPSYITLFTRLDTIITTLWLLGLETVSLLVKHLSNSIPTTRWEHLYRQNITIQQSAWCSLWLNIIFILIVYSSKVNAGQSHCMCIQAAILGILIHKPPVATFRGVDVMMTTPIMTNFMSSHSNQLWHQHLLSTVTECR